MCKKLDEMKRWIKNNCEGTGIGEYVVDQWMQGRIVTLNDVKTLRIKLDEIGHDGKVDLK